MAAASRERLALLAEVPDSHGHRTRAHLLQQTTVRVELLLLRRPLARALQQILRPKQPDPFGPVQQRRRSFLGELRVGPQGDAHAVHGLGRDLPRGLEVALLHLLSLRKLAKARDLILVRIDDHTARAAIHQDRRAWRDAPRRVLEPNDTRHTQ